MISLTEKARKNFKRLLEEEEIEGDEVIKKIEEEPKVINAS